MSDLATNDSMPVRGFTSAIGSVLVRTPFIVRMQMAAVSVAFVAALTIGTLVGTGEQERQAFALPALNAIPAWDDEARALAERVSIAFRVKPELASEFSDWILEASERHHLPTDLIASLVFTESSFRKHVISGVGAIGPAQVRPDYWGTFCGTSDLSDPAENIYCGAQILSYYRERCGNDQCALQAYNVGPYTRYYADAGQRYSSKVSGYRAHFLSISL